LDPSACLRPRLPPRPALDRRPSAARRLRDAARRHAVRPAGRTKSQTPPSPHGGVAQSRPVSPPIAAIWRLRKD